MAKTKFQPALYKALEADESIPATIRQPLMKLNAELREWGERGSVKKRFAEKRIRETKTDLSRAIQEHRQKKRAEYETGIQNARDSFYQKVEAAPYAHLVRRERSTFDASLLTDGELTERLAPIAAARDGNELIDGRTSYEVEALLSEAKSRNLPIFSAASTAMKTHGVTIDIFDRGEILTLRDLSEELASLPPDVIGVDGGGFEAHRAGETMRVRLDQLIDTDAINELA